ncbi:protein-S-isoprenylcysteine O-methyltransferase Ste14 [Microbacterium sp. SORGH_AS 1204]|uniref:phage holin family protein n=1 Tax=Microbacterium sp. SORGH_AS_1204 TaxID=3041785 RepID=UPI0027931251|nr:phage holin family protein [Microbacterium sp. SORGH_AS_1204]MDQ1135408.1 protein-S-isoprenylcysteine O-methyltransferase Ste14 [Microbacterium sp. SORGH_AS_1204]
MTTPRGFRDRSDDSIFELIGDIPELVRNLVVAEINGAKAWAQRTAKDAGIGAGWFVGALVVLFWAVPVFFAFVIAGLSSWWPVWLSALVVFGVMVVITAILALLGYLRFKKLSNGENPGKAIAEDVRIVKEARDEY